jgi:hypothetical protein
MTNLRTRLARAGRRLAAAAPADYSAHWKRVNDERMQDLEALAELIPDADVEGHRTGSYAHVCTRFDMGMPNDVVRGLPHTRAL